MINRLNEQTPKGTKVIVRSNNDEPYLVGEFKGYDQQFSSPFPVVMCDGTPYWSMGIVVEYNESIKSLLDTMTPKDQWNYLSLNYKRR